MLIPADLDLKQNISNAQDSLFFFRGLWNLPVHWKIISFNIFDFCDNSSLSEKNVILKIIDAKAEPPYFKHHPPSPHHEVEVSKLHKSLVTKSFCFDDHDLRQMIQTNG